MLAGILQFIFFNSFLLCIAEMNNIQTHTKSVMHDWLYWLIFL